MTKPCAKHARLATACWNLGGQPLERVNNACPEGDILLVQEVARREPGWQTEVENDRYVWTSHQARGQWRGTAIGIASDIFDSVVSRRSSGRGCALVVRLKGMGRIVLCSVHAPTGVDGESYATALREVGKMLDPKWRHLPCIVGIDVNEEIKWHEDMEHSFGVQCHVGSANFQVACDVMAQNGLNPIPPCALQRNEPTHFPRDSTRAGRQIDAIFGRQVNLEPLQIDAERRKTIGTDHALLLSHLSLSKRGKRIWSADSRPRWTCTELPGETLVDWGDVEQLARKCTKPRVAQKYVDGDQTREAFREAKRSGETADWKKAHKLRRQARREWCAQRRVRILQGDWLAYREHKRDQNRKPGWWRRMLEEKTSQQITSEVQTYLEDKLRGPTPDEWDEELETILRSLPEDGGWQPFTEEEINGVLGEMKANTSVGIDAIGVDLLKKIMQHEVLSTELVDLINVTLHSTLCLEKWDTSLLALLAKIDTPLSVSDLRPISMSSCVQKCLNKLAMGRVFPHLRRPSLASCCGPGRQASDVIGGFTRVRDVVREWKLPLVCAKLDVRGAFDRVHRRAAARLMCDRTANHRLNTEVRWLVRQLGTNKLRGCVPGGELVDVECTQGIKQGAPESAELFGLIMGEQIDKVLADNRWKQLPTPWGDVPLCLLFYQDDVFVWDENVKHLQDRISLLAAALKEIGLELAEDKTQIIASPAYRGPRQLRVGEQAVTVQPPEVTIRVVGVNFSFYDKPTQQAKDLLARTKAALAKHDCLLKEHGPWQEKAKLLQTLVFGTMSWCAGAVHWSQEDLATANTIQCTALRRAFLLKRRPQEEWTEWNKRTCRQVRAWLHTQGMLRWSTLILQLQFGLYGHWGRQTEGSDEEGKSISGNPLRLIKWRNLAWWRHQQSLSTHLGLRHPGRFYPDNTERKFAETLGPNWDELTWDRVMWRSKSMEWVACFDVKWARGRQTSIRW